MKLNTSLSIKEIAQIINAEIIGDETQIVTGINEIHMVSKGDLTFVDHPKYYEKALKSKASYVIINCKVDCPDGKVLLYSEDPFRDYNILTRKFSAFQPAYKFVSDTAIIGENTVIQPGAFIGNNVNIGNNCLIHANVSIYDNCIIGNNVIIHSGTVIGGDAFYFKRRPEGYDKMHSCGNVIIEDNVEIGACCTVDKGVSGDTIIGKGTKMDNHIQIGHDTVIGKNCLFASQVGVAGVVTVEDDVILWGQVGVQKDLTIGKGAIVLGQSGIPKSIEGGKTYFGSPVQEAREKMKELAIVKSLPKIIREMRRYFEEEK
ncbi:MAG: UDP-3-O-(3-hydroxymyristoyl)glucosamine N-acyltransferase [Bacteroidetes bacterium GWE2_29_8]|nr:MAG: UDP-3-O-(3-hydroxymyristoyl)glucosamine N-acyltransferase [Bacteroidetes bacterium GWE2_29_8]OFY22330.1 MAG: UDP-3-O-(3-hydroxymyristoyl)glucosamine N-acyltransferase [Bacteroidetes bacterium GWF2_29_10]